MAYEVPCFSVGTEVAAADLTGKQFCFVKMTSTGWDVSGNAEYADGVLQNDPDVGQPALVMTTGVTKLKSAGTLTKGNFVSSAAAGVGKVPAATNPRLGRILQSANNTEIATILLGNFGLEP